MEKARTLRFLTRVVLSATAGLAGFAVVVLTVSALVSLTYPHNDKALGLYAMLYGLTLGLPLGALAFSAAFRTLHDLGLPPIEHKPQNLIG